MDIQEKVSEFVHKYVELSEEQEKVVVDYALETWQPLGKRVKYLQFLGGTCTGKTRALRVMEAIVKNPLFVYGASSSRAVLGFMNNQHPCTLILEEADLMIEPKEFCEFCGQVIEPEEQRESVFKQILASGASSGNGLIWRRGKNEDGEHEFEFLKIFGHKIIATRGRFDDMALQSRCIAIEMQGNIRSDTPMILDPEFVKDALEISVLLENEFGKE